jgi:uracil-DNA glycosylase
MRVSECIGCKEFPCADVKHECYVVPGILIEPEKIRIAIVSEATPSDTGDHYYAGGKPLFEETTVQAFRDAGADVSSVEDILELGVYLTTAVKCGKAGRGIRAGTIKECSLILEQELALFPNLQAVMPMGDVAIKAINHISTRAGMGKVVPAGSSEEVRGRCYCLRGTQVFPSLLHTRGDFFVDKRKREIIAEDIEETLKLFGRSKPRAKTPRKRSTGGS